MQKIFLFIVIGLVPLAVFGQNAPTGFDLSNYGVKVEAEKRLMVVLAALEMARGKNEAGEDVKIIKTPLSESGGRFRTQLLQDNTGLNEDLRSRISIFVIQYKKRHPKASDAEIVSPFISMAFALSPVPELLDPAFTGDLPGELLDVLDFAPLAREFYRRSGISGRLNDYVKIYRTEADGVLRTTTREMVSELLDYLHTRPEIFYTEKVKIETQKGKSKSTVLQKIEKREHERSFFIVPEMLAPSGNVNFLNIKDDYYVVVPPDKDLSYSDVRRAFLQFVVDPLVLKNSKDITAISASIKPLLDERRKTDPAVSPDVYLTVGRSLIAAIDAREIEYVKSRIGTQKARNKIGELKTVAEKEAFSAELKKYKQTLADETALQLSEAYEHGAVLAFYFAEQLKGTEDSGFDIASSMREMIATFDGIKEKDRLAENADARKRAVAAREDRRKHPVTQETVADNPVTIRLLEIKKLIDAKNFVKANADLKKLLADHPSEPRIYYNIGRVASLAAEGINDPDVQAQKLLDAKVAFGNVISSAKTTTDKALLSLTYVALARIYEFFDNPKYAMQLYDKAIQLDDVTDGAYRDAIAAKQRLLKTP